MSSLTDKFGQKTNKQMKIKQNTRYVLAYHDWGSVKCTLRTDCGLLFLELETMGLIMGLLLSRFHLHGENNSPVLHWPVMILSATTAKFLEENRNTGCNTMGLKELVLTWKINNWTFLRALQK